MLGAVLRIELRIGASLQRCRKTSETNGLQGLRKWNSAKAERHELSTAIQEPLYEFCHSHHFSSRILFNRVDDCAAHDRAFGESTHCRELPSSRNSEADRDGKLGETANPLDETFGISRHLLPSARYARA